MPCFKSGELKMGKYSSKISEMLSMKIISVLKIYECMILDLHFGYADRKKNQNVWREKDSNKFGTKKQIQN